MLTFLVVSAPAYLILVENLGTPMPERSPAKPTMVPVFPGIAAPFIVPVTACTENINNQS